MGLAETKIAVEARMALIPEITFPLKVPNIMYVQGVPWLIQICKETQGVEKRLEIRLCCKKDDLADWKYSAAATVKLVPFGSSSNVIEKRIKPSVFNCLVSYRSTYIPWSDIFDNVHSYVQGDAINLEIKITAEDYDRSDRSVLDFKCLTKSCEKGCLAKYYLTISHVSNLFAVASSKFKLHGLPWKLIVYKSHTNHLGIYSQLEQNGFHNHQMRVRLVPTNWLDKPIEIVETYKSDQQTEMNPFDEIISWDELHKPDSRFIRNDSVSLEVEFSVDWFWIWDHKNCMKDKPCNAVRGSRVNQKAAVAKT
ncbi:hypothetical protein Bhyg_05584 [Pseudolycoriella hygida]|uniref:MATH domain-containing protein n=1 Tax=Pseudolycoriella hygida TaxID=35572 RepID=A0A9Q0MYZ7_9DIPT|nr:hypothetical protein Bhyg_05584 [Pseudolycoriella hygida]